MNILIICYCDWSWTQWRNFLQCYLKVNPGKWYVLFRISLFSTHAYKVEFSISTMVNIIIFEETNNHVATSTTIIKGRNLLDLLKYVIRWLSYFPNAIKSFSFLSEAWKQNWIESSVAIVASGILLTSGSPNELREQTNSNSISVFGLLTESKCNIHSALFETSRVIDISTLFILP